MSILDGLPTNCIPVAYLEDAQELADKYRQLPGITERQAVSAAVITIRKFIEIKERTEESCTPQN